MSEKGKAKLVEVVARALLDAMDRQSGDSPFSWNVNIARLRLREVFPRKVDSADIARKVA